MATAPASAAMRVAIGWRLPRRHPVALAHPFEAKPVAVAIAFQAPVIGGAVIVERRLAIECRRSFAAHHIILDRLEILLRPRFIAQGGGVFLERLLPIVQRIDRT